MRRLLCSTLLFLTATAAVAQQRFIFDPDDVVDPRVRQQTLFISRLVLGAAKDFVDDYRPLHQDAGFVHLANSFYWKNWQFDYKRSEVRGEHGQPDLFRCGCQPPVYFPTPPPPEATPAAPQPGSRDSVQFGWYHGVGGGPAEPAMMLRYRLSLSRQHIGTVVRSAATEDVVERRNGHEQSIGVDADTYFRFRGHDIWGAVLYARTSRSGTIDDRAQQELAYMSRFRGWVWGPVLARATLTLGGISNRGGTTLNLVNPAFEAFWHHHATGANVHLVYSPLSTNSGVGGWETHHQIALFFDRALYVKRFR